MRVHTGPVGQGGISIPVNTYRPCIISVDAVVVRRFGFNC